MFTKYYVHLLLMLFCVSDFIYIEKLVKFVWNTLYRPILNPEGKVCCQTSNTKFWFCHYLFWIMEDLDYVKENLIKICSVFIVKGP